MLQEKLKKKTKRVRLLSATRLAQDTEKPFYYTANGTRLSTSKFIVSFSSKVTMYKDYKLTTIFASNKNYQRRSRVSKQNVGCCSEASQEVSFPCYSYQLLLHLCLVMVIKSASTLFWTFRCQLPQPIKQPKFNIKHHTRKLPPGPPSVKINATTASFKLNDTKHQAVKN